MYSLTLYVGIIIETICDYLFNFENMSFKYQLRRFLS